MYQFREIVIVGLEKVLGVIKPSVYSHLPTETLPEVEFPFGHTSTAASYSLFCMSGYNASSNIANVRAWAEVSRKRCLVNENAYGHNDRTYDGQLEEIPAKE